MRPRLFSQRLDPRVLRLYRVVLGFFLLVFLAMIWPVATVFSRVYPLVFGLPFSLFYIATLLVLSFCVLLALYLWEGRTGNSCDPPEDEGPEKERREDS